ncbi:hypothetical protein [Ktedonobacter robiniae]|uniref:DUF4149 domain-containing protein n=1 Tax=Ktedonobacter robiniae TaxID=2778365 RepID=A0ABQ3URR4_9CHLR|nr:hypothetical protein [Ktedonobacter robiniae]GHO55387.1 hypothetical protein KSB_38620 [Ktedonobacter robiniae]
MVYIAQALQVALPFLWLGLLLGISFLETPLKFRAPGITQALGLGIGRLVFTALNRIEILLVVILIGSYALHFPSLLLALLLALIIILVLYQSMSLRPVLNRRAEQAIAGNPLPTTHHHKAFILVESLKALILLALGWLALLAYMK